ncbi:RTA1-domain-containing protein [Sporormia fimetaria CBS 119925]|uniref:RTA1-domain-containing protein n=1 Tax=Sporormia fimetaria CBS 119925 TaxID=1340428 RepID=A0A6A6V2E8_9PLEO|nr:RTA1-domain-containing protein [Sporormia fimetaria CBS 119925]
MSEQILCTEVSYPLCPVEETLYGYYPSIGANGFFAGFFALCLIINLVLGIKYKTWTYLIALGFGCLGETVGYVGRILLWKNPYSDLGFQIQICCLIISPAFIAAGIYLSLKHIVLQFGESWSRLRPSWYTWLFISGDLLSLVLQGAGGGLAATADNDEKLRDLGTNLMIAGVIWQVVCLALFGYFLAEYAFRTHRHRDSLSSDSLRLLKSTKFRLFIAGIATAYVTVLARCVYRIPELTGGWGSELMKAEAEFIVLEGVMIVLAVLALTAFHPGYCFPALANTIGKNRGEKAFADNSSAEVERA